MKHLMIIKLTILATLPNNGLVPSQLQQERARNPDASRSSGRTVLTTLSATVEVRALIATARTRVSRYSFYFTNPLSERVRAPIFGHSHAARLFHEIGIGIPVFSSSRLTAVIIMPSASCLPRHCSLLVPFPLSGVNQS